jgi:3-oxoacyl-[acyl-carrier protein] reductase/bacilysin biosynthesis oxidoreductase BacG
VDLGITGKVALITGASRGIGRDTAAAFAAEGTSLVLLSRRAEALDEFRNELQRIYPKLQVQTYGRDATDERSAEEIVDEAIRRFGGIDILVNNVGASLRRPFEELTPEDWSSCLSLNLLAAIRFSHAVIPGMKLRRDGRIINVAALSGVRPRRGQIASNVAKAGLINFTKSLAMEMAPWNILVNSVLPGTVQGSRFHGRMQEIADEQHRPLEEVVKEVARASPLGRVGKAEEVAGLVVFLSGRQASYITGAAIEVDGGLGLGL